MNTLKIAAIVLVVLGILGLVVGGFSYREKTHSARMGPLEMSITKERTVNIPLWVGVGAVVVGGALLIIPLTKSQRAA